MTASSKDKLIVALDVPTVQQARDLVQSLKGMLSMFKVGSQLFTAAGPAFVKEIISCGSKVFLDLKFHDIPNTVAMAGIEATRLGVSMFNVHALGGAEMMRRTVEAVSETVAKESLTRPAIIAVTVLTSADANTLSDIGIGGQPESQVRRLAQLADACGMDGVVASPREIGTVRSAISRQDFLIVTPGVRPSGSALDDQRRITTPVQAVEAGADFIVVGRPITSAKDPAVVANQILEEIQAIRG